MEIFFLSVLAAIAIHRIWNYERIFEPLRQYVDVFTPSWASYVFTCAACNGVWVAAAVAFLSQVSSPISYFFLCAFAIYPFIRIAMWVYAHDERLFTRAPAIKAEMPVVKPPEKPKEKCGSCEKKKADLSAEQKRLAAFEKRVVIITTLSNFNASYSLSSCIIEQARSLALARKNWLVQVWTMQITKDDHWPKDMPANVELRNVVPHIHWANDEYDPKAAGLLAAAIGRELVAMGNADVITHDILFQASFINFAAAIHSIRNIKAMRWWHQAHSGPSSPDPRPELPVLYRHSLPEGHRFLNLNEVHTKGFMSHYGLSDDSRIDTCENVRDVRSLLGHETTIHEFITKTQLADADIVQIYPVSTTRMHHKGVKHIIKIFGSLKNKGKKVRLVIPNAHANNNNEIIKSVKDVGRAWGLTKEDLIFTSDHFPKKLTEGLSAKETQLLFQYSNLFIFPTIAEASSLVLAEAALAGALILPNTDVPSVIADLPNGYSHQYPFGNKTDEEWPNGCGGPDLLAQDIIAQLEGSLTNKTKRWALKTRNLDVLGAKLVSILERAK